MKTLWVVGAGVEAVPGIKRAKTMGLRVIASDGNPSAPGFAYADERVVVDTYNAKQTAYSAGYWKARDDLHGVIAMCSDVSYTVARVAAACRLPGLPTDVAALGLDKVAMKERLLTANIPVARWCHVDSPKHIVRFIHSTGRDVVVKPRDSRGARGVSIVTSPNDALRAYAAAVAHSPTGRVMAEEFLEGEQFSTEAIFASDGAALCLSLRRNYDRLAEFAPFVIEDGADGPYDNHDVNACFLDAARVVVKDVPCTVKGDMVLTKDGPKVIELALRLSGGYMSTELLPRMTGIDVVGTAIRLALGERVTTGDLFAQLRPGGARGVAIRYDIPAGCTSHPERGAHYIGEGATREEAIADAEAQREAVRHSASA